MTKKTIGYAYKAETESHTVYTNDEQMKGKLGQAYDAQMTKTMTGYEYLLRHIL